MAIQPFQPRLTTKLFDGLYKRSSGERLGRCRIGKMDFCCLELAAVIESAFLLTASAEDALLS